MRTLALALLTASVAASARSGEVKPEPCHLSHLEDGVMAIVHYGLNTYCDREWGYGDTSPSLFDPQKLDTDQWVDAMVAGGVRRVVMVAKHHDGFNLWPSKLNPGYTIADTPWKGGKGDLLKEVRDSCLRRGVAFGVYLSPWDRHQPEYARPAYVDYYHAQWDEILANYGPLCEIWLDGACGGDGWYGGAKERRAIPGTPWDYYRIPALIKKLHAAYPGAIVFGGEGPHSAVWVGNEAGVAPDSVWYATTRGFWETPECDTPLRRGWFWHCNESPKSLFYLVECYFASVGHGCVMNLGIAPNRDGLVGEDDVRRLKEFGDWMRAFNAVDFAADAKTERTDRSVTLRLARPAQVNCLDAMEEIAEGQRITGWTFEAKVGDAWKTLAEGAAMGYRRLARFATVESAEFRLTVTAAKPGAKVGRVALRFAAPVARADDERSEPAPLWGGEVLSIREGTPANEMVFDFVNPSRVSAFRFRPESNNGVLIDRWELLTSADGKSWTKVEEGEFGNIKANPVPQWVYLKKPVRVRHLKIVGVHAIGAEPVWNRAAGGMLDLFDGFESARPK